MSLKFARVVAMSASLALANACVYVPPITRDSLVTANGVRLSATSGVNNNCGTPALVYDDRYILGNIIIEQDGKTRRDPVFDFRNRGLGVNRTTDAVNVLSLFDDEFRGACVDWLRVTGEEKDIFLSYHNEALTGLIETATRLEAQTTVEGFVQETRNGMARWRTLVSHKPKGARWWSPRSGGETLP